MDDDEVFRRALTETLQDDGYQVYDFADPTLVPPWETLPDALVLIVDYRMSSSDGLAFADAFQRAHAGARVVMITSYSTPLLESELSKRPHMRLLTKPLDYTTLVRLLRNDSDSDDDGSFHP